MTITREKQSWIFRSFSDAAANATNDATDNATDDATADDTADNHLRITGIDPLARL